MTSSSSVSPRIANRYDWTLSSALLFGQLYKAQHNDAQLDAIAKKLMAHESRVDIELLFEYAVCYDEPVLVALVAKIMRARMQSLHIETIMRIAIWSSIYSARSKAVDVTKLANLVDIRVPHADKFVLAMITVANWPLAFGYLLAMVPPLTAFTLQDANFIVSVAWDDRMVAALVDSWINDKYDGVWLDAPRGWVPTDDIEELVQVSQTQFCESREDVVLLETTRECYWTSDDQHEASSRDHVDEDMLDASVASARGRPFCMAVNTFISRQTCGGSQCSFGPYKRCREPTHRMCAWLNTNSLKK